MAKHRPFRIRIPNGDTRLGWIFYCPPPCLDRLSFMCIGPTAVHHLVTGRIMRRLLWHCNMVAKIEILREVQVSSELHFIPAASSSGLLQNNGTFDTRRLFWPVLADREWSSSFIIRIRCVVSLAKLLFFGSVSCRVNYLDPLVYCNFKENRVCLVFFVFCHFTAL